MTISSFIPQIWARVLERTLWNRLALDIDYHTWHMQRNDLIQTLKRQRRRTAHYTWFGPLWPRHGEALFLPNFEDTK